MTQQIFYDRDSTARVKLLVALRLDIELLANIPMHIRDRLRTAFLRKEASRVCWRCALSPRPQLRSIQIAAPSTRSSEFDTAATELDLLFGKTLPTNPDFSTAPTVSSNRDFEWSPVDSVRLSGAAGNDETLDLIPKSPELPIRRYLIEDGRTPRVWEKVRYCFPGTGSSVGSDAENESARKETTSRTYRDRRRRNSSINQKPALGSDKSKHESHGKPTRSHLREAVNVRNIKQSQAGAPSPKTNSFHQPARGRIDHSTIRNVTASRSTWRLSRPVYNGPNYSRVYVFRAGHKRRICILYADPERLVDLLKEKGQLKKETENLLNTWLEVRDPPTSNRLFKFKSNQQEAAIPPNQSNSEKEQTTQNLNPDASLLQESLTRSPRGSQSAPPTNINKKISLYPLDQQSLPSETDIESQLPSVYDVGIRKHLALWQELQSKEITEAPRPDFRSPENFDTIENTITHSGEEDSASTSWSVDPASARDWGMISSPEKDSEGDTDVHNFLLPGDVIGFGTKVESILALFIRNFENQSQFYTMQGKWVHRIARHESFTIRGVFSQREIDHIVPYLPDKQVDSETLDRFKNLDISVPREVGSNILQKLQAIQSESAEIYRDHSERLDRAHSLVAHEVEAKEMTLQEIALVVLQKRNVDELSNEMLWAANKAIVKNANFRPQDNIFQRSAPRWRVNPLKLMRRFEQVRVWIRDYVEGVVEQATTSQHNLFPESVREKSQNSNPIPEFIRKARTLVQNSRALRSVTTYGGLGPSSQRNVLINPQPDSVVQTSSLTTFNEMEMTILRSLKTWCISRDIPSSGTAWSLPPMLLRATELYEGQKHDEATGFLFLQELGVIAPWENRFLYDSGFRLPNPAKIPGQIDSIRSIGTAADQSIDRMTDSLEGLRKDWGDMSVYCIDDADAKEIDDGISLERMDGDDSIFWIHVHVANPSAFISPDGAVSRYAADLLQSIYLPEKTYHMLDSKLTQEHFSIAKNRPVLTFSAKISLDGEIHETSIKPGWVHNTKKVTPRSLGYRLGLGQESYEGVWRVLKVGQHVRSPPQTTPEDELSPSDISTLLTLQKLGSARRSKRSGHEGTQSFHGSVPDPSVYIARADTDRDYNVRRGRQFIGDPTISWEAREVDMTGELSRGDARAFVADIMILAGEVAARWCSHRSIPVPYRGTIPDPAPYMPPQLYKSEVIDRSVSEKGYVPIMLYRTYNRLLGQSTTRPHPFSHAILGTESYVKVTSPMRRYADMLAHWQIHAALLYEAKHGEDSLLHHPPPPLDAEEDGTNESYLPFSHSALSSLLPQLEIRERSMRDLVKRSKTHWIIQLLHRAFYFGEESLPERLEVLVHAEPRALLANGNAMGYVKQLSGIDADLLDNDVSRKEGGIKLGDWWEARMEGVDPYAVRLRVTPVRLLAREEVWNT
ncbi:MAG: hypothetical protein Q9216_001223 [Gyalolechia sp. 2 TL-2023]